MVTPEDRARQLSPGGWGTAGSASSGPRYAKPLAASGELCSFCAELHPDVPANPVTTAGFANGVALCGGCRLCIARWVRGGYEEFAAIRAWQMAPCAHCPDSRRLHLADTGACQHEGCRCDKFVAPD